MNLLVLLVNVVFIFGSTVLVERLFKKSGLYAWIAIATITANIITAKMIDIAGITTAIGTIEFASVFLATDILSEKYGRKEARKGVFIGLFASIAAIIIFQIALLYNPSAYDYANDSMETLFGFNLRISSASVVMFFVANIADVWLFNKIKDKTQGRFTWLRNNVSTIVCNCLENFAFIFLAFIGVYSAGECVEIALTTSVLEIIVALLDTPFLYLATHKKKG